MQLETFLEQSALRFPDKTALVCGERRLTYQEIEEQSNRLAHGLIAEGVERGDRVAVYLDNSVEAVLSIFGILKAGAVFMTLNPTTKGEKLAYILNNSRSKALITHAGKFPLLQSGWNQIPDLRSVVTVGSGAGLDKSGSKRFVAFETLVDPSHPHHPPVKRAINIDLAALIYTSGSTGNPKGVMMTHLNMVSAATSITTYLENTPDDIILNVLPLSFDYGLYQILMGFKVGGTVVLERSFTYPHAILETVVREGVTGFPIVPTILAILLQMDLKKYNLGQLRYITNTGAALPTPHVQRLRDLIPHVKIFSMYGLTECKRVSYLPPDQIDMRPSSVGKGMPNEEVYIVDENGSRLGPGRVGELVVRGANVMKGYWDLPEETDKMLKPGPLPGETVLYTGDLFRMDEEGYLYFLGRKDDIIKSRGEKVSPKEVENVLYQMEGILEAAVIGVPDEILGQAVKAVVSLKDGDSLTEKKILSYASRHLEDIMIPKYIEIRPSLPKTESGKIRKTLLQEPRVSDILQKAMIRWAGRTAVTHRGKSWSYGEIHELTARRKEQLAAAGVAPGDRVVIWMDNSVDYIATYLAILDLGAVVAGLHSQLHPEEVSRACRHIGAAGIVTEPAHWVLTEPLVKEAIPFKFAIVREATYRFTPDVIHQESPADLAQIIYTSGTTGQPKAVMLTHKNLVANITAVTDYLHLTEKDSVMAVLPFPYAYGNSVLLTHLFVGARLVIENSFIYPNTVLNLMGSERVTGFSGVPSMYALLIHQSNLKAYSFPHLRYLTQAGGPMPVDLLKRVLDYFPGQEFYVMYGQTEATARLTYLSPQDLHRKGGSVGQPISGVSLKVVDETGQEVPQGRTGEICASGDNIMAGYWDNPEATREIRVDGWLRTGDIGYLDEEGYLYICGRNSEIIKSGAFRINPTEIEEVILKYPAVREAVVLGVEDPILGDVVVGLVTTDERLETQELLYHCSRHLAHYKCPRAVYTVAAIHKSLSGKILRAEMRELAKTLYKAPSVRGASGAVR